jgi:carnitine 3-dehydrogenase
VAVFDPDPEAERKIGEVLANARRPAGAVDVPLPARGQLSFAASIAEAVAGADWIQESVPERLDLKHTILPRSRPHARRTRIGSSTSGFKPSELQEGAAPRQIFVAHPFNPVYLLPLVELVPAPTTPDAVAAGEAMLTASA